MLMGKFFMYYKSPSDKVNIDLTKTAKKYKFDQKDNNTNVRFCIYLDTVKPISTSNITCHIMTGVHLSHVLFTWGQFDHSLCLRSWVRALTGAI